MTVNSIQPAVVVQIGIIVRDIERTAAHFTEILGVPLQASVETPGFAQSQTYFDGQASEATAKLAFFNFGQVQIELIQPDEKPSVWREFLDQRGEGVHHIAFKTGDTHATTAEFAAHGIAVRQQGLYTDGSGMYTYLGSEEKLGLMLELLENYSR